MSYAVKHDRRAILDYIITYKKEHDGNSPSFRNIMKACGVPSSSNIQYILLEMEQQGLIRIGGQSNARTIEVVGGRWEYTQA